jgi:hypothetical protein
MMNSTLFSVRVISPVSMGIRSRGTTMWTPLDAWTVNAARVPVIRWARRVHTPVVLMTRRARTAVSRPLSLSRTVAPVIRSPSRRNPVTSVRVATRAPYRAAVRATIIV